MTARAVRTAEQQLGECRCRGGRCGLLACSRAAATRTDAQACPPAEMPRQGACAPAAPSLTSPPAPSSPRLPVRLLAASRLRPHADCLPARAASDGEAEAAQAAAAREPAPAPAPAPHAATQGTTSRAERRRQARAQRRAGEREGARRGREGVACRLVCSPTARAQLLLPPPQTPPPASPSPPLPHLGASAPAGPSRTWRLALWRKVVPPQPALRPRRGAHALTCVRLPAAAAAPPAAAAAAPAAARPVQRAPHRASAHAPAALCLARCPHLAGARLQPCARRGCIRCWRYRTRKMRGRPPRAPPVVRLPHSRQRCAS